MVIRLVLIVSVVAVAAHMGSAYAETATFSDSGWTVLHRESFDVPFAAADDQTFGDGGWLIFQLLNGGAATIANGYVTLQTPEFRNAALIRSTDVLPEEYKIRTRVGHINYDLANYESADYNDPAFNDHGGYYENGMYLLTITDDTCVGSECAELWWHYHRKMVIDVDNHLNYGGGETFHPIFMVYMDPAVNSGGNLLRTWDGTVWDSSTWNWNVAHTYEYDTWYYAELEKRDGQIRLRLYDGGGTIIEDPPPIGFEHVFAITDPAEYLYVGEPHTDDYEGNVRIDEITLLIPETDCCEGDVGNVNGDVDGTVDLADLIYLVNAVMLGGPLPVCPASANINGDGGCNVDLSDLTHMVNFLYLGGPAPAACVPQCR